MRVVRLRSARLISAAALLLISVNCTRAQEQSNLETLGGLLGLGNTAIQGFGEAGETLKNFAKDDFVGAGTGSLKRGLARGWNEALQPLKDAAQSVRERLSFKIADKAFQVADWAPPLGALSGGDVRGSVSGATQVLVGGTATGTGAAFFGAVGTGAGAVVGSFFPVVGNIVGAEIGGAIGTVAGGLIGSYGYDKYLKDYVGAGVEGGFAAGVRCRSAQTIDAGAAGLFASEPVARSRRSAQDFVELRRRRGASARLGARALRDHQAATTAANVRTSASDTLAARPGCPHHRQRARRCA